MFEHSAFTTSCSNNFLRTKITLTHGNMYVPHSHKLCFKTDFSILQRLTMKKYLFKILVLIGITLPQCAVAHPDGAPAETCGNMMPSHGAVAQTGQSPYLISATTSSYKCKDTLTGRYSIMIHSSKTAVVYQN